jgi:hypothetical protein
MVRKIMFSVGFMAAVMTISLSLVLAQTKSDEQPITARAETVEVSGIVQSVDIGSATFELQDGTLIILRELPDFQIESGSQLAVLGDRLGDGRIIASNVSRDDAFDIASPSQLPPILIDLTGQVNVYDTRSAALTINGVTGILLDMPDDPIQIDTYLTVSGELLPDGRILIDTLEPFQPQQFVPLDATGVSVVCHIPPDSRLDPYAIMLDTDAVPVHLAHGDYQGACDGGETSVVCEGLCDPLLVVLSDAFSVPYTELAEFARQGLDAGAIAQIYTVADLTGAKVDELVQSRRMGVTWQEILQSQPRIEGDALAIRSMLGDGRGTSIRATQ